MLDIHAMLGRRLRDLIADIEQAVQHPDLGRVLNALTAAADTYEHLIAPAAQGEQPKA